MRPRADQSHDSTQGGGHPSPKPRQNTASSADAIQLDSARESTRSHETPGLDRLAAAACLIGDESPQVRRVLMKEFLQAGRVALPHLRRAANSPDARVRSHGRKLLEGLRQQVVVRRMHRRVGTGVEDLESSLFLLASLERPNFDVRPYRRALDAMGREVNKRCRHLTDDLARAQLLVRYLGKELGFRGNFDSYSHPDNVHLHRVIETKQGLPLSLCALYSFVAKRCSIHTGIVPLPGHVMLRLYGRHQNLIVDPFHAGEAKSQEDLVHYLKQHGLSFNPVWMHDASPKMLFLRQVRNLRNAWRLLGNAEQGARLSPVIRQLAE